MILIGQYDSPFVRRVGIAATLYGLAFEHRPWSSFGDADKLRVYNPLTRVPTLVLDDGVVLVDSFAMLDHLDSLAPTDRLLIAHEGPARRQSMAVTGLATGVGDKAVSLFYEQRMHVHPSSEFVERCRRQIENGLAALEADRTSRSTEYWFGSRLDHADIAAACVWRIIDEALPGLVDAARYPSLARHSARCEALPVFQTIRQHFIPPT